MPVITIPISDTADDVTQQGTVVAPGGPVQVGFQTPGGGQLWGGLRFLSVNVPVGATINSASLLLTLTFSTFGGSDYEILWSDTLPAPPFDNFFGPINVSLGAGSVAVPPDAVNGAKSFDITSLIEAAVADPNWSNGTNLTLVLRPNDVSNARSGYLELDAELEIDFTPRVAPPVEPSDGLGVTTGMLVAPGRLGVVGAQG